MTFSKKFINEIGNQHGRLVVLCYAGKNKHGHTKWRCQCDCGNRCTILSQALRKGTTKSCGCYKKECTANRVGPKHHLWKNKYIQMGYLVETINGKHVKKHRMIAEKALGRSLKKKEVVHHINGIKTDNKNSNLLICSVSYHTMLHTRMAERYQELFLR